MQGFCDTITDEGGWLIMQMRQDRSVDFGRDPLGYEDGFGSLTDEFWYAHWPLCCLTSQGKQEKCTINTYSNGNKHYLSYASFRVGPASSNYTLHEVFEKILSDPLATHQLNGPSFITNDKDNDSRNRGNCAVKNSGGWSYLHCSHNYTH